MAILYFSDILKKVNIDPKKVKLIRHPISHADFRTCYDAGKTYEYTCHQSKDFSADNIDYWAVFIGEQKTLATLYAIYEVNGYLPDTKDNMPDKLPKEEQKKYNGKGAYYSLKKSNLLSEYEGRLTIEWGGSTRRFYQRGTTEKAIVAIKEKKTFEGYDKVLLSYGELKDIIDNPSAYGTYHSALKSVYAVYLIVDTETGQQYVGSAYGKNGLLSRWECYVKTKHGTNKKMEETICQYPERYRAFQFSILQILPKNVTKDEVRDAEDLWKNKLLSRKFGMNGN